MIERLISQLSKELELPKGLEPKAPGEYVIPLEEHLSVDIREERGVFYFSCLVGLIPSSKQEDFYQNMLHANLFGQGTYGAVLGLNEEGDGVILQQTCEDIQDYRKFKDHLEDFFNAVDFWKEELA